MTVSHFYFWGYGNFLPTANIYEKCLLGLICYCLVSTKLMRLILHFFFRKNKILFTLYVYVLVKLYLQLKLQKFYFSLRWTIDE